jgi:ABC-2 type transport system permease protein
MKLLNRLRANLDFLLALWKANMLSAMEYRAAFLTQAIGMAINDAMYFVFWIFFFNKFKVVNGWEMQDMVLMFGLLAAGLGLARFLFGNTLNLADLITNGSLDYYLSLPKPALLHILASRSDFSALGDFLFGISCFFFSGNLSPDAFGRYLVGLLFSALIFISFMVLVQSLAFYSGSTQMLSGQASSAIMTFATYPITLFDGTSKFILFTLLPAAFIGSVPAEFVRSASWESLLEMLGAAVLLTTLAGWAFQRGLKRYESGSAIQTQVL